MTAAAKKKAEKIELFCRNYVKHGNATQAAIEAGYSEKGAAVRGSELLRIRNIQDRVEELRAQRRKRVELSADWVLKRLMAIAGVDIADLFDDLGNLLPIKDIKKKARFAVSSIETYHENVGTKEEPEIQTVKKIKLCSKEKALELLGRHLEMFTQKHEHKHVHSLEALVAGEKDESTT